MVGITSSQVSLDVVFLLATHFEIILQSPLASKRQDRVFLSLSQLKLNDLVKGFTESLAYNLSRCGYDQKWQITRNGRRKRDACCWRIRSPLLQFKVL